VSKIKCQICNQELSKITHSHLRQHDITTEEYKQRFPNAELVSNSFGDKIRSKRHIVNCSKCGEETETAITHKKAICERCKNKTYPGLKYVDSEDKVVCQICWRPFERITNDHIKKEHQITLNDYKKQFPDSPLVNKKGRIHVVGNEYKEKIRETLRYKAEDWIREHPFVFEILEEMRNTEDGKDVEVRCKFCRNWFIPSKDQINDRWRSVESEHGTTSAFMYCSDKCKNNCDVYGKSIPQLIEQDQIKAGLIKEPTEPTYYEYQIFREEVLKRQRNEIGYNECELCESIENLHVHHEKPKKTHPNMTLDPDNGIILCRDCHLKKIHSSEECKPWNLGKQNKC